MKKHGKAKKRACIILLCIFLLVYFLWGRAWTRRWFISSDQFFHRVNPPKNKFHVNAPEIFNFPERLPASADGVRYYYCKGFLDEKYGISFTLDREEYQDMKEEYLRFFNGEEARYSGDKYFWFEFNEKMPPGVFGGSAHTSYYIGGAICNDERNEMIIFYFFDAGRNVKRNTETEI